MMLGAGICRTRELEAAGVAIGLGADASAANDNRQPDGMRARRCCWDA